MTIYRTIFDPPLSKTKDDEIKITHRWNADGTYESWINGKKQKTVIIGHGENMLVDDEGWEVGFQIGAGEKERK